VGQIVFLNPFPKTLITGGIKAAYSHAEILAELGFNATVFQPDGAPVWLPSRLQELSSRQLAPTAADILVFPEVLNGWLGQFARDQNPAKKVMFCQNQYYMFSYGIAAEDYAKFGFTKFIVPGKIVKRIVEGVLRLADVSIIPYFINPELFFPREKVMQIATVPRKFPPLPGGIPGQAALIRAMLALKYPHLRSIPWQIIEGKSEQETADILGRSSIFLALSYMEACPLAPLEAMASNCIVVGYTGYGGLEYATSDNGIWLSPEQLEEVTDALASVIDGLTRGDPRLVAMQEAGMATAGRFGKQQTSAALRRVYGAMINAEAKVPSHDQVPGDQSSGYNEAAIKPDQSTFIGGRESALQQLDRAPVQTGHVGANVPISKNPPASHRLWRDIDIITQLTLFVPGCAGPFASLAELTMVAANDTIPLLARLLSLTGKDVLQTVPVNSFSTSALSREGADELQALFNKYGSDKSTAHDYHHIYGHILQKKHSITAILEIGLGTNNTDVISNMGTEGKPGASLRAFRDFMPNAKIYGADVDKRILFSESRIQTFFVDQTDPKSFESLGAILLDRFDLIIDDGLHSPSANLASLNFSLDRIKPGGWIIIEDIAHNSVPVWKVASQLLSSQFKPYLVICKGGIVFAVNRIS
jgi:hypothetical protein